MTGTEKLQEQLQGIAEDIAAQLSVLESSDRKILLSEFVSELYFSIAEQEKREFRRQRQAEGIAAAKARGVHFGRQSMPLPEDFDELHEAFRAGKLSLRQAAERCGMTKTTFHSAVVRKEQSAV